jgi:hypothetical protein
MLLDHGHSSIYTLAQARQCQQQQIQQEHSHIQQVLLVATRVRSSCRASPVRTRQTPLNPVLLCLSPQTSTRLNMNHLTAASVAAFSPQPKDWSIKMNKKERRLALATALQSAAADVVVVDNIAEAVQVRQ